MSGAERCSHSRRRGRLLAVYAVPADHVAKYSVDPCWQGPHITLAGFAKYPARSRRGLTYRAALRRAKRTAKACQGSAWHATTNDAKFTGPASQSRDASYRHLEFAKGQPSRTLEAVAARLRSLGFRKVLPSKSLGPHATFDQCGCFGTCSDTTFATWDSQKTPWYIIPVTAPAGTRFRSTGACQRLRKGKITTYGQCRKAFPVKWHMRQRALLRSC